MNEKINSNNIENEFTINTEENDYKNLIINLKEINATIVLLKKIIFKN